MSSIDSHKELKRVYEMLNQYLSPAGIQIPLYLICFLHPKLLYVTQSDDVCPILQHSDNNNIMIIMMMLNFTDLVYAHF